MNELIKFGLLAAVILLAMSAISKLSRWFAEKLDLNQKVVGYVVAFIVFLICSALWSFTPVYDYISQITGIPCGSVMDGCMVLVPASSQPACEADRVKLRRRFRIASLVVPTVVAGPLTRNLR